MLRIFLAGMSSFIGRNLLEYLSDFSDTFRLYAPNHAQLDLMDEEAVGRVLRRENFDIILNAAMYNREFDHPDMLSESLRMFFNLEKYSSLYGKMYYFGSGAEFDKTRDIVDITEEELGLSIPKNYYGLAKYIMAKHALSSSNIYNLRLFGVFGKYEDWRTKFISNACCRAILNLPVTIRQNTYFDYLYIGDLCRIVGEFLRRTPKYHDYNVVSGSKADLFSIAQKVVKRCGMPLEIIVSEPGFKQEYTAGNKRMLDELDIEFASLDKGIDQLYNWYLGQIEFIDRSRL